MKLFVWDFGWAGGVAIVSDSVENARKIILENKLYHSGYVEDQEPQIIDLNTPYEFMGDS